MNSETMDSTNMSTTGGMTGTSGINATGTANVQKVAQKAHQTVDKLEQTLSSSAEKVMGWQQEYGEAAREQVRANPLAVVAGAFALGYLLAKVTR